VEGPEGGYFVDFLFDRDKPDWVLAGGDDSLGIWKSENGGKSWTLVSDELLNVTAWEFARDSSRPGLIYATDIYGRHPLLRSTDGGETWADKCSGITYRRTHGITVAMTAHGASRVLVGCAYGWGDPGEDGPPDRGAIFASEDLGETWKPVDFPSTAVKLLETAPDETTVYAGTARGLFRSDDAGDHWEPVQVGLPKGQISGLEILDDGHIFVAVPENPDNALYRSTDGGQTWAGLGLAGHGIWDVMVEPESDGKIIYAGTLDAGVMKTTDGGATWQPMNQNISSAIIIGLGLSPSGTLLASTYANEGILRSTDGAKTWRRSNSGLTPICLSSVRFDPNDRNRLLVGALGPYSFAAGDQAPTLWEGRLRDGRVEEWKLWDLPNRQVYAPSVRPGHPGDILVGTFGFGLLFSKDGGDSFEPVHPSGFCTALLWNPENPDVAIASIMDLKPDFTPVGTKMARTKDGGSTWHVDSVPFLAERIAAAPRSATLWAAAESGLYVSKDDGVTWNLAAFGDTRVNAVALDPFNATNIYVALQDQKLFKSTDRGGTWYPIPSGPWSANAEPAVLLVDRLQPERLYVGLTAAEIHPPEHDPLRGGLWFTENDGADWHDGSGTMHCDHIRDLVQAPGGQHLYVATYAGGLYSIARDALAKAVPLRDEP